ncbi:MAG: hypothetical protein ACR2FE_10400 [Aeromicrobium sp.]
MSQRRLPAEIYWRRRLLLLAVLILLVWVGLRWWPSGSDERPVSAAAPTASPSPKPAPTDGSTTVALSSGGAACKSESIRITPSVSNGQRTRAPVDVELSISSTSKKPCTFTAKSSDLLAVISAGKTAIWDSTVCKAVLLKDAVDLSPGWSTVAQVEWSARGSGPACSPKEGWATPGRYTIQIGTLGGEPGKTKFTLTPPPKSKDDEKPDDEKADENKKDENKEDGD